jgi:NAD(P)H-hydrate epimerase
MSVLTPHPGEAARLLKSDSASIQADRRAALARLVELTGAVVVLKGAGSLVGAPGRRPALCAQGNAGMAAPGMGDVLTGAIAAILAQCTDPWHAARAGVLAHALAGDEVASRGGQRGILALEVATALRRWVNP